MRKWNKWLTAAGASVAFTLIFAGCSGGSQANSSKSGGTQAVGQPVTFTLGTWGGAAEDQQLQQLIQQVNNENKDRFKIVEQNTPANYDDKLKTQLAGGTAPDLFYVTDSLVPTFAQSNVLLDLSPYLEKYKSSIIVANPDNYYQSTLKNVYINGKYYALPWIGQPTVMYYNPSLFQQAGLPEPEPGWTWDEFLQDAKKLTNPQKNQYGYVQTNGWPPVEMYMWAYGGDVFSKDLSQVTISQPNAIQGLKLMENFVKNQITPPPSQLANVDSEDLFRQGRVAMFAGGAADGNYDTKGFTAKVAEMPVGTQPATYLYVADMAINAKVNNPDLAFQAMCALLEKIDHWKVLPPIKQYAANLADIEIPDAPNGHTPQDRIAPILNSAKYARLPLQIQDMTDYYNIMSNDIYQPILSGKTDAATAAAKAASDLQAILNKK